MTSLATAREQRHPRRFNTGIIAAAAAVVLLFVAVAAFGLGGGEDSFDVASTQSEAANTVADAPEIESFTDGTSESEAMTADRPDVGALEAAPAPTSAPPQAAASQPAEEEEMAADAASDDGGGLDSETGTALATESLALAPLPLFVGDFLDQEALLRALEQVPVDELAKRVEPFEPGFFPSCQQDVPELAATKHQPMLAEPSLRGQLSRYIALAKATTSLSFSSTPQTARFFPPHPDLDHHTRPSFADAARGR